MGYVWQTAPVFVNRPGTAASGGITHGQDIKNNTSLVGLRVSTTRTMAGYDFGDLTSVGAFGANLTGAGTSGNPYLIDRVLFTEDVLVGNSSSGSTLSGKYFRFTNCGFRRPGDNPTQAGQVYVGTRVSESDIAGLTIEDSDIGSSGTIEPTGGPTIGGMDKAVQSWVPLTLKRCNIWGAAILVYLETEQSEAASLVEECWLHDVWSSAGDHTDMINGNFHASHVTVRRCFINGTRTGDAYVVNGFGIYDAPESPDPAGIIEDWTLDSNYVTRCQTMLLSNTSTSRFLDPFVVTNNIWTTDFTVTRFSARTPSSQSSNRDENGNPLTL